MSPGRQRDQGLDSQHGADDDQRHRDKDSGTGFRADGLRRLGPLGPEPPYEDRRTRDVGQDVQAHSEDAQAAIMQADCYRDHAGQYAEGNGDRNQPQCGGDHAGPPSTAVTEPVWGA